jgi:hypothetical protein
MHEILEDLERLLAWFFVPATLYGAAGAILRAGREGGSARRVFFEGLGGAVCANMAMPLAAELAPPSWHWTLFFLMGWGGLELVGRLYQTAASLLEKRLRGRLDGRG